MKKSYKQGYSLGFEALFLIADLVEANIPVEEYMVVDLEDNTSQPTKRCLPADESTRGIRSCVPRYVRCIKAPDVALTPQSLNTTLIPEDGNFKVLFARRPKMSTPALQHMMFHGLPAFYGGTVNMELRYGPPHPGSKLNGINNNSWHFEDELHGGVRSCTNFLNGTLPGDIDDDDVFVIDAQSMHAHCYHFWYNGSTDMIEFQGGIPPQFILGVIQLTTNTVTFKNADYVERMIDRSPDEQAEWRDSINAFDYPFFDYDPVDMNVGRGDSTPQYEENHVMPGGDRSPVPLIISIADVDNRIDDKKRAEQLSEATDQEKLYIERRAVQIEKTHEHSMVWVCRGCLNLNFPNSKHCSKPDCQRLNPRVLAEKQHHTQWTRTRDKLLAGKPIKAFLARMLGLETDGEADQSYGDDGAEFVKTVNIKKDPAFDIIDYPAEVIRPVVKRVGDNTNPNAIKGRRSPDANYANVAENARTKWRKRFNDPDLTLVHRWNNDLNEGTLYPP